MDSVIPIPQETRNNAAQETGNVVPQDTRHFVPAPTPPPNIPLPPIPLHPSPALSLSRISSAPHHASFPASVSPTIRTSPAESASTRSVYRARNPMPTQNRPSRVNSLTKRPLPPSPTTSTSSVMFDLDPDPFAAPPLPETVSMSTQTQTQARGAQVPYSYSHHPTLTRLERQHAAWKKSREDLGRVQMVIGEAQGRVLTPPPMYSIEFDSEESGRAI
ncbi:hypothetical protein BCR39DRAFT_517252 [Naematelia encephala]|uniref:Uncharacterized protein n=1 Tax=Naematelia encephala TaxID=71784 RepID=A0A1Y2BHJ0_9TREE|nr:hypothetical protein BCR39DRAFT_517252 [Naematelia encephala]